MKKDTGVQKATQRQTCTTAVPHPDGLEYKDGQKLVKIVKDDDFAPQTDGC